jgi:hypothetical protein
MNAAQARGRQMVEDFIAGMEKGQELERRFFDMPWFWSQVAQAVLQKAVWRGTVALNAGWPVTGEPCD